MKKGSGNSASFFVPKNGFVFFRACGRETLRGFSRQVELLKAEGVGFLDDRHVDMENYRVRALPLILEE